METYNGYTTEFLDRCLKLKHQGYYVTSIASKFGIYDDVVKLRYALRKYEAKKKKEAGKNGH